MGPKSTNMKNEWLTIKIIDGESVLTKCSEDADGEIIIPDGVTRINYEAFLYCSGLNSITIPESVTDIGFYAFKGCTSLASVTIPNSVTSIRQGAFQGCSALTSIAIPESVTSIGKSAFSDCFCLTSIVVDEGNTVYDNRNNCNAIIEKSSNTLLGGCQNTIIPNGVTSIGEGAFAGCIDMTSITIPNSVTIMCDFAFEGCSRLTSVTIPNSVTSIGGYTFRGCYSLTSVTIPDSVTSIGEEAFYGCSGLTSVTIAPSMADKINKNAFEGCWDFCIDEIPDRIRNSEWPFEDVEDTRNACYDNEPSYYEPEYDWERETFYALGGSDYDEWKENGGNLDDMMDRMGF